MRRTTQKAKEVSSLLRAGERIFEDSFTERYGLQIRKATPDELAQEGTGFGFGSATVQDALSRHHTYRLTRGLRELAKEGE